MFSGTSLGVRYENKLEEGTSFALVNYICSCRIQNPKLISFLTVIAIEEPTITCFCKHLYRHEPMNAIETHFGRYCSLVCIQI
jgi:hypothetical protein